MASSPDGRRIVAIGAVAAFLCALSSLYYLASIFLYPLWIVMFVVAWRRHKRAQLVTGMHHYGIALAASALLMPIAGGAGWLLFREFNDGGAFSSSEPFYWSVYGPVAAALAVPLLLAAYRSSFRPARRTYRAA